MKSQFANTLKLTAAVALAAAGTAHAAFLVTVENAGVTNALSTTFSSMGVETFSSASSNTGFTTTYGASGITGTYSNAIIIKSADQYGGAGGTGTYAVAATPTGYSLSLSSTSTPINYFGFYLSALDAGNTLNFFKSGSLVYTFTPTQVLATLASGSGQYFGNPASSFLGRNGTQPYAFLNFYDQGDSFDTVQFSQTLAGAGYESDNHTFGTYLTTGGTTISPVPEPETYALMLGGLGLLGLVARRRKTAAPTA